MLIQAVFRAPTPHASSKARGAILLLDPSQRGGDAMQATVVMLLALGGLGCQNPVSDLPPIPSVSNVPAVPSQGSAFSYNPAPSGYATYAGWQGYSGDPSDEDSFGSCLRDTFCSFFIGRSPDVPSAREIEAAYYSGRSGP
jgi:hypothetical protein